MNKKSLNNKFSSAKCKYQLIAQDIQFDIFLDRMKADTPLPSVRSYAEKYSVSPNTIVCAFRLLKTKGLIYSNRTKNYCISKNIEQIRIIVANKLIYNLLMNFENLGYSHQNLLDMINDYIDSMKGGSYIGKY